jgi:hypothetical protein
MESLHFQSVGLCSSRLSVQIADDQQFFRKRVGVGVVIGIVPYGGAVLEFTMSLLIWRHIALNLGAPSWLRRKMFVPLLLSTGGG